LPRTLGSPNSANLGNPREFARGTRSRQMYCRAGGWATLRHSPIESPIKSSGVHSNREKKKPKQDKNKKKRGEAPSPFAVKLGTSYMTQYGKKH